MQTNPEHVSAPATLQPKASPARPLQPVTVLTKYTRLAANAVRARGLLPCATTLARDILFDVTHGVDTFLPDEPQLAEQLGPNASHGVQYQPVDSTLFHRLMVAIPANHQEFGFLDYGCGKGKALLLASRYPFNSLVGIDYSQRLLSTCRRNLLRARRRQPNHLPPLRLVHGDVCDYLPAPRKAVFFFYNPFDAHVMQRVIHRITATHGNHLEHYIILANPQTIAAFESVGYSVRASRSIDRTTLGVIMSRTAPVQPATPRPTTSGSPPRSLIPVAFS